MSYQNIDGLIKGLEEKNRLLQEKTEDYLVLAEARAQAERSYNISFAIKTLELKSKHPVTIIKDLVKGDEGVAARKFELDKAEAILKACSESMKDIRSAIDSYRSILSWKKAEFERS